MKNAIFKYSDKISLGKSKVTSNGSTSLYSFYEGGLKAVGDSRYKDFSALNIKVGDKIYWQNPQSKTNNKLLLGSASAFASNRVVMASATEPEAYDATLAYGYIMPYVIKKEMIVSYPCDRYVGARMNNALNKAVENDFSTSIVSLYFERTAGYLDEVRLNIKEGRGASTIQDINKVFKSESNKDIVFFGGKLGDISNSLLGVNKILTSISTT